MQTEMSKVIVAELVDELAALKAERDALRELVESAITDFCKLGDVIGPAGYTVATFYQEALDAIKKGAK